MSVLALRGITVRYGRTTVIDGLDWTVGGDRLVTALLGPSGCGKSTLLRAIAGLEPPAAGTLTWDGADLRHVPVHRRDFGVVFQDGQLFSGRTVAQNIAYGLRLRKWPRARIAERVDEMLALVQLPGAGDRRVTDLSGGQAQRVALARALAPRPRLLLLDEPLAALDARLREELAFAIGDIVRAARTPAVVVTHDRAEAALIADDVSVMHDGAIIQTAPPDRLWRRPADDWVAGFLGATLLLDADVTAGRLRTPFGSVSAAGVDGLAGDGPCRVALRPESLRAEPTPNGGVPEATGTVTHAAALPSGIRLRVRTATSEVDALASSPVGVGDRVRLILDPAQVAVIGR
ncbi:ABC transporter ATP-binding protein [Gordonia sp. PP30]|uniref:ABC transporter ATP-binding protein n=1 Tax=Gordonia sp. PP30 TaxID=2935861 RepID=UPI001FFF1119|nr:ABC transporter ATP-binding protein [Gordonia sp. PP30]UQE74074.1 ABC transporter ATP-binding protein [Gordonia sp. PP30]